jgi:hypothetical protein
LWLRGEWSALVASLAFGAALNLVLVSSFIWPELLPTPLVACGWLVVLGVWSVSLVRSYRSLPELRTAARVDDRGLFIRAQGEYLKGHWLEAETLVQQLLRRSPLDVDAHLLLATLYRHTRRTSEALERLRQIERHAGAERWEWEIRRERELLEQFSSSDRKSDTDES